MDLPCKIDVINGKLKEKSWDQNGIRFGLQLTCIRLSVGEHNVIIINYYQNENPNDS